MASNKRGCFCLSLRTAALFHGWLNIIVLICLICVTLKQIFYNNPDAMLIEMYNISLRTYYIQQVLLLIVHLFDIFLCALVIGGITLKTHYLILPWIVIRAIGLIIVTPLVITTIAFAVVIFKIEMIIISVIYALIVGLFIWSWTIVYSFNKEIRETLKNSLPMSSAVPYFEYQRR
ncbi:uncharacterized protein LOC129952435 [Eupeodes corollae]|uniref:uncharacterized protein LOC129952435 n=1 Tax=Eupeodes corollae TaxID=290404 RepID=UPI0024904B07|nr:uncharacterized protein LOC129952435 [Eupeodes corollae]